MNRHLHKVGTASGVSVPSRTDTLLAAAIAVLGAAVAIAAPGTRPTDPLAIVLLLAASATLPWRRQRPGAVLLLVLVLTVPFHMLDYRHEAASPIALVALATFSASVARVKALVIGLLVVVIVLSIMGVLKEGGISGDHLGAIGWVFFSAVAGQAWRWHAAYVASIIDRAERAERTREEEARRRVAEERVRIARDLHDLLAHSITLIGVQAGVAAHLARQPEPDREVLAAALETIADGCRAARAEVRSTLTVLRDPGEGPDQGAVPGLAGVGDLAESVRGAGVDVLVDVALDADADEAAPAVGVAAYRIVQEALTNVVRHAQASRVTVDAVREGGLLRLTVADDGRGVVAGSPEPADGPGGFGILGMAERARSVGGTLTAEPGKTGGFTVRAVLPLPAPIVPAPSTPEAS
ncbi:sensor histidine kinase [Streptodolium elevatio]